MKILLRGRWRDGFLDYHRAPAEVRVEVSAWLTLEPVRDLYFVRPRSIRLLWNYLPEVGVRALARKVVSRSKEAGRNEKYVGCGLGRVTESDDPRFPPGAPVAFVAPMHPACVERVVLPPELLAPADEADLPAGDGVLYLDATAGGGERWWEGVRGWSPFSGQEPEGGPEAALRALAALRAAEWTAARTLETGGAVQEARGPAAPEKGEMPTGIVFGYGNYAKTNVVPNVRPWIRVEAAHEVDPTQIPEGGDGIARWDTSPWARDAERFDVWFIAGFHHTHAPLAVEALRRGAWAVVEKPVVTDAEQLEALAAEVERGRRFFSCFHKRYLPLNELALADLGVRRPGDPVSYHCMVFEVPLPALHWYRWPSSRSRLVSNGCHWLDHFLYLNDFAAVARHDLVAAGDGTVNVSVELENGAFFTMALTDRGSARIGVQDYVELRANGVTVRMHNGASYVAEGPDRILRRRRINKMTSYAAMYRTIARRIRAGEAGDSARSLRVSSGLVLALEARLREVADPATFFAAAG